MSLSIVQVSGTLVNAEKSIYHAIIIKFSVTIDIIMPPSDTSFVSPADIIGHSKLAETCPPPLLLSGGGGGGGGGRPFF